MANRGLVEVQIVGVGETLALLGAVERGAAAAADYVVLVGTDLAYAYGVHQGRRRSGRLARRAGGAFFLTRAMEVVRPRAGSALARALLRGPAATVRALVALGEMVRAEAAPLTPVRSGSLRRSLHTELARRR